MATAIICFFSVFGNEFVTQLVFATLLFLPWKNRRKIFIPRAMLSVAALVCCGHFIPYIAPWNYLIIFVLLVCVICFCFRCNFVHALFYGVTAYCTQYIISAISYISFFSMILAGLDYQYLALAYSLSAIITMLAVFTAAYFLLTRRLQKIGGLCFGNPIIVYASALFIIVAVFLTHYGQMAALEPLQLTEQETLRSKLIIGALQAHIYIKAIALSYSAATLLIIFMNCNNKKLETENNTLQLLLKKDEQKYEQAKQSSERIKTKYHDLKHREHQGVLSQEDIGELDSDKEAIQNLYFTGNKALDIIISEKAVLCEKEKIKFICTADGNAIDFVKPHHIYSLLGNAFDNAIEGLSSVREEDKREINTSITRCRNMSLIRVSNYFLNNIVVENGFPKTTKADKDNHGFGVKSMKTIAELYGGNIYFSVNNNLFTLLIMIPIPE